MKCRKHTGEKLGELKKDYTESDFANNLLTGNLYDDRNERRETSVCTVQPMERQTTKGKAPTTE